ncbi:probable transcription regulator protein [Moritella sp. PE36]|uniref:LysR family transcriptional regulator n=1 Tax=Moritella sp. PE36 TaxID=58051 RepID=UPI00015687F6|nr:LysR family transcriptional regulator [Moritella sp. PE36]EDM68425.1 probable transcription regulator protein [Moritella sp. PE36]
MERQFLRKNGITLEQLRCFVCVYETRSITSATHTLAKTQSAVTLTLQKFEETIGQELFIRRAGKNLDRTENAQGVYINAIDILKRVNTLCNATKEVVRVGIPDDLSMNQIIKLQNYLLSYFVGRMVTFTVDKNSNHKLQFSNGNIDLYFHKKLKVSTDTPLLYEGRFLYTSKLIWVSKERINVDLIDFLPLVSFHEGCIPRASLDHALALLQVPHEIMFESFSWTQNIEAIKFGFGVGVILDSMHTDDLVVLGSNDGFPELWDIDIYLIGRQGFKDERLADGLSNLFNRQTPIEGE